MPWVKLIILISLQYHPSYFPPEAGSQIHMEHTITALWLSPVQGPCCNNPCSEGYLGYPFPLEVQLLICPCSPYFSIDSHCWCLRPHLLPCLELAETKGTVFGVNLTWTQNHPPQLQAPASIQINTLQTVLSLSFFHYKILYFLPFAIEAHIIKYPAVLFLGQTKTQQKPASSPSYAAGWKTHRYTKMPGQLKWVDAE